MTLKQEQWTIGKIANNARKNINSLDLEFHKEVIENFEKLEKNPFENNNGRIFENTCAQ